jgi:multimeric flavodoxin WrbA
VIRQSIILEKAKVFNLFALKASLGVHYFLWFPSTSTILETIALKVVAFNGSALKNGNTALLLKRVLSLLETEGFETELIQLAGQQIRGCIACRACFESKDERCFIAGDNMNLHIQKMKQADAILFGSPTYFGMMSPELKSLIDRAGFVTRANPELLKRKVAAAVAVARRKALYRRLTPSTTSPHQQDDFARQQLWNIGVGSKKGDVEKDEEALRTIKDLGKNIAWLLTKLV